MIRLFWLYLAKLLLWLRYRIRVRGLREVAARGRRGILFLPTHPALIDPVILLSRLVGPFGVRALGDRDQIDRFLIRRLARRFRVLPIPDMTRATASSAEEVRQMVAECVRALRGGDSLILYPAGRTLRSRFEDIGGNSAVESILRELPEVRVVLVRMRGLWGSAFSYASGRQPDVAKVLRRGFLSLLASGIFFAPRRDVTIELVEPGDFPRTADRATLNRTLETFCNDNAPPNTYVPYTLWERGGVRHLPDPEPPHVRGDLTRVSDSTRKIVHRYLTELTGTGDFGDAERLAHDLGMDSLSRMELITWLHTEFGFPQGDTDSLRTVGDVMLAASGEAMSAAVRPLKEVPPRWFRNVGDPGLPEHLPDMTVTDAFLAQARRLAGRVIIADQAGGVKTYRDIVLAVLVLRREIERLPGERVGVMMPASVAADVLYLATLFAGKTPAMVNWTLGRQNIEHCLGAVGVERILTARALVERLGGQGVDLDAFRDRFVYLEDIGSRLTLARKMIAWSRAHISWRSLDRAKVPPTAAILFTSGSESVPKAVPLTHRNILTNVADADRVFTKGRTDSILGILPPFHSFGLTTSVVLPLCLGLRAAYSPNPTDGVMLGRMIDAYRATLLIGTPTFLFGVIRASTSEQLRSLRLVVSGAEKCTPRVYDALTECCPQTVVMEGYGVTECSPIVSVNPEDDAHAGTIGRVVASLEHAIVHPETGVRVARGASGMLLVRGPSVFDGYLNYDGPSPFVTFEAKQWYRTGDLVSEDDTGVLTFSGRLKRFVKLGGEMVSLPAIESVLAPHYTPDEDEGPVIAVVATPDEEHPEIVLFTTRDVDRESANRLIREAGLSGLHNIRRVVRVDELPLLGTGKTDYLSLTRRLEGETP